MVALDKLNKISVIIPAYDKRKLDLGDFVDRVSKEVLSIASDVEIVIVCLKDDAVIYSEAVVLSEKNENISIVEHDPKIGKEYAYLLEGFKKTRGEYVLYVDPHSKLNLRALGDFRKAIEKNKADIVIGSKHHTSSKVDYSDLRKKVGKIYYLFIRHFLGLNVFDLQTGMKLYKREVLKRVIPLIVTKKYAFDLEILTCANHLGYKIVEAPVEIDKSYEFEKLSLPLIYHAAIDTLAVFYRLRFLKFYDRMIPELKSTPKVSIVIAVKVYNQNLEECLNKCRELDYPDYEVIVLPDEKMNKDFAGIKEVPTGNVLPPAKRDIGIKAAQGKIIAFLDDDAFPVANWIKSAVRYFEDDSIAAVGGPAVTPDNSPERELASGVVYASSMVAWKNNYRYIPKTAREVDDYPTCNLFVRKDALEEIGGFDNKFWPGEDTIVCYKIVENLGKKIYYDPDALVYHRRRALYIPHLKQVASYALHRGYFVKRYPETSMRLSYFFPSLFVLGVILGPILGQYFELIRNIYIGLMSLYLIWALLIGILCDSVKMAFLVISGIFLTHVTYGIYFIKGLLAKKLQEEMLNEDTN
jgi:GT2 family glycosyltransferase